MRFTSIAQGGYEDAVRVRWGRSDEFAGKVSGASEEKATELDTPMILDR